MNPLRDLTQHGGGVSRTGQTTTPPPPSSGPCNTHVLIIRGLRGTLLPLEDLPDYWRAHADEVLTVTPVGASAVDAVRRSIQSHLPGDGQGAGRAIPPGSRPTPARYQSGRYVCCGGYGEHFDHCPGDAA